VAEFDDSILTGRLDRLVDGLKQLDANLTRQINEGTGAVAQTTRDELRSQQARAAREARARPTGRPGAEPVPQVTNELARQASLEREIAQAAEATRAARQQDVREANRLATAVERVRRASDPVSQAAASLQRRPTGTPTPESVATAAQRVAAAAPPPPPRPPARPTAAAGDFDDELRRLREQSGGLSNVLGGSQGGAPSGVSLRDVQIRKALGDDEAAFAQFQRTLAAARSPAQGFTSDLGLLTRQQALAGDQMRRHGLLTTEFLAAAADGRTTVRELGVQLGGTIAKFGGWTAAASLTYGGLAALQAVGKGALDSAEGVNKLQRVVQNLNTEKAQEQFRGLASAYNLPIGQVADASFEAAKAFRNQADTAEATKAALAGVKVGEIEAGDAARYVTAIYRGFGLEVSQLGDVMDVVNQLQNKFGADFRGTAEGVAKSAGAFGAAGGQFRELAALVATGELATGRTGAEIGTALRRTSEIVKRPDRRQTIIDVLGIDPRDHSITDVIEQAQKKVAQGADVGEVARAITTPELASGRIIPILQRQDLYQRTLREAQPDRATGSVNRELTRALKGIRQEIEQIGVNLQNLGSALAQSGALDLLGSMVIGLNNVLQLSTQILEVFNTLPEPLRQGLLVAGELTATLAVARRFGLGGAFAEGGILNKTLSRDPARLRRAEIIQGIQDEKSFIVGERQRATSQASRLAYSVEQQQGRVNTAALAVDANPGDEAAALRYKNAQARLVDLDQRKLEAIEESEDLARRHEQIIQNEAAFRRESTRRAGINAGIAGRDEVDQRAINRGILQGSSIEPRPQAGGIVVLPSGRPHESGAELPPGTVTGGELAGLRHDVKGTFASEAAQKLREERAARERGVISTAYRKAAQDAAASGSSKVVASSAGAIAGGNVALRAGATNMKNLGVALAGAIGPLEIGMIALLSVYESYKLLSEQSRGARERIEKIDVATSSDNIDQARKTVAKQAKGPGGFMGALTKVQDAFADVVNFIPVDGRRPNLSTPNQEVEARARAAKKELDALERANRRGVGLSRSEIFTQLQRNLQHGVNPDDAFKQAELATQSTRGVLTAKDPEALKRANEDVEAFRQRLKNYKETINDVDKTYGQGLTPEELTSANTTRIFTRGLDNSAIKATARALGAARNRLATTRDPAEQTQIIGQIQTLQGGVEDELKRKLDQRLQFARNPTESGRLRSGYLRNLRRLRTAPIERQLAKEAENDRNLHDQLSDTKDDPIAAQAADKPRIGTAATLNKHNAKIDDLKQQIKDSSGRRKRLRQQLKREQEELGFLEKEEAKAQFEARQNLFDARTDRLQSETADPREQARILVARLRQRTQNVREALRKGIATQDQLEAAIAAQNRALQQAAQASLGHLQAQQGLAAAQFAAGGASEGSRLSFAVSQAQTYAAAVRAQGNKVNPDDLLNAQKSVADAQTALREYVESQAKEMVSARADLAASLTDNPIRQANIRLNEATQLQRFAKTPAEKLRAQAEVNNKRRERQTTVYNEQIASIDFEADIGKIDKDTQIRRLEGVLRTIRGNRDLKRELRRRIYQLKQDLDGQQDELSLDVGNIKLPTIYEIRRAAQGGLDSARQTTVINSPQIAVHPAPGREGIVADVLDSTLNTSTRSAMRAGGLGV
jgi:TP901 family phage tail tape measure protein